MNAEQHGDDVAGPRDDAVAAAFAAYKADAPAAFPPPPVDELIMSGPAALRRRRLVSLAAVVGACTAVTAGGFAVAQTLGSLPSQPDEDSAETVAQGPSSSDHTPGAQLDDPATPQVEDESPSAEDTEASVVIGQSVRVAEWGECAGGVLDVDFGTWEFTEETDWSIVANAGGDIDGDQSPETILALQCGERTAVAAFTPAADGLEHLAWVWRQPDESQRFSEIAGVEDGTITLQGLGAASETWTARYEWDGEAFVAIDDAPTTEPSSSATTATPDPGETQTTQASPTDGGQVS
ncbi:hypothetical protein [Glycomyces tenuis]|uniref:hypothetical protein n=1 Tax=Glycomyces tenuis TaxID=58116 RepID=UPI0003F583C2|nr:hypothetical protein [Glycomyces tenuis]